MASGQPGSCSEGQALHALVSDGFDPDLAALALVLCRWSVRNAAHLLNGSPDRRTLVSLLAVEEENQPPTASQRDSPAESLPSTRHAGRPSQGSSAGTAGQAEAPGQAETAGQAETGAPPPSHLVRMRTHMQTRRGQGAPAMLRALPQDAHAQLPGARAVASSPFPLG